MILRQFVLGKLAAIHQVSHDNVAIGWESVCELIWEARRLGFVPRQIDRVFSAIGPQRATQLTD